MPRKVVRRTERIALYVLPTVEADRVILDAWNATQASSERSQDIFRRALLRGLREMAADGELPESVLSKLDLRARLKRRLPRAFDPDPGEVSPARREPAREPFPGLPEPSAAPIPATTGDAVPEEPDMDAILGLMGGGSPLAVTPAPEREPA